MVSRAEGKRVRVHFWKVSQCWIIQLCHLLREVDQWQSQQNCRTIDGQASRGVSDNSRVVGCCFCFGLRQTGTQRHGRNIFVYISLWAVNEKKDVDDSTGNLHPIQMSENFLVIRTCCFWLSCFLCSLIKMLWLLQDCTLSLFIKKFFRAVFFFADSYKSDRALCIFYVYVCISVQ